MHPDHLLKGSTAVEHPTRIASARERLLTGGPVPDQTVRAVIEASWQRCLTAQVDPRVALRERDYTDEQLHAGSLPHQELISASKVIMREARSLLAESGTIMHLVSPSGLILRYEGDPATLELAHRVSLVPGADWNEAVAGTNAIGTALSVGSALQVHAFEHFCENISQWTCSAAVIRDPFEGTLLGAVNISGLKDTLHDYCLALALSGARRIEGQLAQHRLARRDLLLDLSIGRLGAPGTDAVLLFDLQGRLVRANHQAGKVLAARGIRMDLTPHNPLLIVNDTAMTALPATGATLAQLDPAWVEPILHEGEQLGFLAVIPMPTRPARSPAATAAAAQSRTASGFARLAGQSPAFLKTIEQARRLSKAPIPVLLQGETGVGKELFARAIHEEGANHAGPFVALNCGGLSRDLLAGELFGHIEGAFTGARRGGMTGKIEAAHGGTLFLDEIGEMPLDLQPMFLRVLQESEICRIGETKPRKVNFRLIAATNRNLAQEVSEGRFRMDLYYRVSSMILTIPALRERRDDIPLLAGHILDHLHRQHGGGAKQLSTALLQQLAARPWSGNIRELTNLITAAFFLCEGDTLTPTDLPDEFQLPVPAPSTTSETDDHPLDAAEKEVIARAIQTCNGNLTQVAKQLNIAKSTLYIKLRKYGLKRP